MDQILGYQPYRGYIQLNKNPITQQKEEIIVWEQYNDYGRYPTYESAFQDISTAYGGAFANRSDRTFKIEPVIQPGEKIYSTQPIPNSDEGRSPTSENSAPQVPKDGGVFPLLLIGGILLAVAVSK